MTQKDFTGGGDPGRSLGLLWGRHETGRRGPKPRFSAEDVVAAATTIADAEGLPALSMRRVAEAMGVSPMSLYTYVPSKAELVDLMFDRAMGAMADPDDSVCGWRARLTFVARQRWALVERHPWVLDLALHRPPLGPNVMAKYEWELQAVEGIGLDDVEMDAAIALVNGYVHGAVRSAVEAATVIQRTGITDKQWWEAHEPLLDKIGDTKKFPLASRVGTTVGMEFDAPYDSEHSFEFGLARVLDGIATLLGNR